MSTQVDEFYSDGLHEECGVFGVYDLDGVDVASTAVSYTHLTLPTT